jgi:hypothetical protein
MTVAGMHLRGTHREWHVRVVELTLRPHSPTGGATCPGPSKEIGRTMERQLNCRSGEQDVRARLGLVARREKRSIQAAGIVPTPSRA